MPRGRSNATTTAPAIGAHRARTPRIGSHRQSPVLQLQQGIGNQATQQALQPPVTENYHDTHISGPFDPANAAYDNAPSPSPSGSSYYNNEQDEQEAEEPNYVDIAPEPPQAQAPEYVDSLPLQPQSGHAQSPEYVDSLPFQPQSGPQAQAPGGQYGVYRSLDLNQEEEEEAQEEAEARQGNGFAMQPMGPGMQAFDTQPIRANPHMHTQLPSTTFYADTPEKQAPYSRAFTDDGKLTNASDGSAINTIGAERPAAIGAKGDRHIFAMDGQGKFHTADAIKENKDRSQAALASGASQQERFHHSSFLAGQDVAGAGEMQVRDGQVELVSDTSGHYRPGSKQMMQTVQQLEKNKVQTEKLGVEFVGKSQGQKALQASAVELLGYQDHSPETAETQMRAEHGKKDTVLRELLSKAHGKPDGANLKPSELNAPPPVVAPQVQPSVPQSPGPGRPQEAYAHYNNVYENEAPEVEASEVAQEDGGYNNVYEDEAPEEQEEQQPSSQLSGTYKYYT